MARIADKHGLTNKYRMSGMKRVVKRGRPRKYLLGAPSRGRRKTYRFTSDARAGYSGERIAKKDKKEHPILNKVLGVILMALSAPISLMWVAAIVEKRIGLAFVALFGMFAFVLGLLTFKGKIK